MSQTCSTGAKTDQTIFQETNNFDYCLLIPHGTIKSQSNLRFVTFRDSEPQQLNGLSVSRLQPVFLISLVIYYKCFLLFFRSPFKS